MYFGVNLPDVSKPANGRLGDILKPILQLIMLINPDSKDSFYNLVGKLSNQKALEDLESLESEIVRSLLNLTDKVNHGKLPVKDITEAVNKDKSGKYCLSTAYIGKKLSALGFEKAKTSNGSSAIIYDVKKNEKLLNKYGILPPDAPVQSVDETGTTGTTGGNKDTDSIF
jgi:hypothetical protein